MKLFNTLTRRKEEFVPLEEGKVRMYVCGPTVYNLIHIGNARPMIIFDTVRRYMEYKGYEVNFVSNFTDVDDKIIKKADRLRRDSLFSSCKSQLFFCSCLDIQLRFIDSHRFRHVGSHLWNVRCHLRLLRNDRGIYISYLVMMLSQKLRYMLQ